MGTISYCSVGEHPKFREAAVVCLLSMLHASDASDSLKVRRGAMTLDRWWRAKVSRARWVQVVAAYVLRTLAVTSECRKFIARLIDDTTVLDALLLVRVRV